MSTACPVLWPRPFVDEKNQSFSYKASKHICSEGFRTGKIFCLCRGEADRCRERLLVFMTPAFKVTEEENVDKLRQLRQAANPNSILKAAH